MCWQDIRAAWQKIAAAALKSVLRHVYLTPKPLLRTFPLAGGAGKERQRCRATPGVFCFVLNTATKALPFTSSILPLVEKASSRNAFHQTLRVSTGKHSLT